MDMDQIRAMIAENDGESLFKFLPLLILLLLSVLSSLFKSRQQKQQQSKPPKPSAPSPSSRRPETLPTYARKAPPAAPTAGPPIGRPRSSTNSGTPARSKSGRLQPLPATRKKSQMPSQPPGRTWSLPEAIALPEESPEKSRPITVHLPPDVIAREAFQPGLAGQRHRDATARANLQAATAREIIQPSSKTEALPAQAGAYPAADEKRVAQNLQIPIDQAQELVRAVVWAEIIGRPRSLKPLETLDF